MSLLNILPTIFCSNDSIFKDATVEVFLNISDYEKAKQKYRKKLELLRGRFTKNKE
ncbi:MAG: hypothetical protein K0R09_1321 [Clostridiales bacterium]|jgi:hypothetical protein|nr:hypothetical protein [Clostridiales bacterium]